MNVLAKLKDAWEEEFSALCVRHDQKIEVKVRKLVGDLRVIRLDQIVMGMGTWTVNGPDVMMSYDDGSEGSRPVDDVIQGSWDEVKGIDEREVEILEELIRILDWWTDVTGGIDIDFTESSS